jgi:aspartate racemase
MKTIGVLGGLGPQATMDFETRVHAVSQRLIPGRGNQGYPPMVVYYHRRAPVVTTDDGAPVWPLQLDPLLLDAARRLGAWADLLVITSNGVHRLQREIEEAAGRPVLSMIEVTLAEVARRGWRTVGVLTYIDPVVYQAPLKQCGLRCETIDADLQGQLDEAIPAFTAGGSGPTVRDPVARAVAALRCRGVDGIILGCTELPLMLGEDADAPDLINPAALLADATVRYAIA